MGAFETQIPSIFDNLPLQCRLEHPGKQSAGASRSDYRRAAIIAHPYAPLGGSYDDAVVRHLVDIFLAAGHVVGTFNFRGAHKSQGKTSYTGRAEVADYVSFYGFMLIYLYALNDAGAQGELIGDQEATPAPSAQDAPAQRDNEIVLAGYSYGSLITSHLPPLQTVASLFDDPQRGSSVEHICMKATEICSRHSPRGSSLGGHCPSPLARAESTRVAYLLVSPILPPISSLLTLTFFRNVPTMDFVIKDTAETVQSGFIESHVQRDPVLVLTGLDDGFTFRSALNKFEGRMRSAAGEQGLFECVKFHGVDHFWREYEPRKLMEASLRQWLSKITSSG